MLSANCVVIDNHLVVFASFSMLCLVDFDDMLVLLLQLVLVLGFCLITGVFYSWARGSVSNAPDSPVTNEASGLLD